MQLACAVSKEAKTAPKSAMSSAKTCLAETSELRTSAQDAPLANNPNIVRCQPEYNLPGETHDRIFYNDLPLSYLQITLFCFTSKNRGLDSPICSNGTYHSLKNGRMNTNNFLANDGLTFPPVISSIFATRTRTPSTSWREINRVTRVIPTVGRPPADLPAHRRPSSGNSRHCRTS